MRTGGMRAATSSVPVIIPAKAGHGQGTCPCCRAGTFKNGFPPARE